ncbi:YggS family pyridoxal phosphate-dependent enzyme [Clostridium sp. DJ247]|uniref:YggS family pyridoxal phosphate-dependent enzyme n=1 Tax=Clostridium sp. DJ247 TaxID=2726188 RepID=UPI00162765C0|nr:YggS family pyridoxal phosphate-dependent enzyme [Clostridium sp. DJ247]MBC2580647.1 YggS family pyridoxal phosphate-dependent enzyme [Clostridium sp. DJ247]MBC2580702.1 YggS family pyridoxal phosphate-dependent enzyme [Clostridium sp. DJ247]
MSIGENIYELRKKIPQHVTLVAVSKTKSVKEIEDAYNADVRDFGENKVQELTAKYDELPKDIRWHLIGHLQRNKVKYIVGKVHLIHSLDSIRLLDEIERHYKEQGLIAQVLIQINIGKEENKTGIYIENLEDLLEACENCSNIQVKGLMTVIPKGDEESCRYYFKQMKNLFNKLCERKFKNVKMEFLSMGMTGDYSIAIEEGANVVRIGEGIFGKRMYNNK